jgi:arginine decarboxylase
MKNKYIDLVEQTFDWPAEEFELTENGTLAWNDLDLMPIVKQYGTPLRINFIANQGKRFPKCLFFLKTN